MSIFEPRLIPTNALDAAVALLSEAGSSTCAAVEPAPASSVTDTEQARTGKLPSNAVATLIEVFEEMAAGCGVTLIPEHAKLSIFDAANFLNVSCDFVIKLIDENKIPYLEVQGNRRIRADDLMAYKDASDKICEAALAELVAESEAMGLYD